MNIIKSILGLVKKQFFITPADKDVLIIGKRDELRSSKEPIYDAKVVTFKTLKEEIAGGVSGGADVPEIKGTSIDFVGGANALVGNVQLTVSEIKALPFEIFSNISCTGITYEVTQTFGSGTLQLGLYKYDYENDIWNLATEQLDAPTTQNQIFTDNFSTPQALTPGKYCIAWRGNSGLPFILGIDGQFSKVFLRGDTPLFNDYFNTMVFTTPYSASLPASIVFDSANFIKQTTHEVFKINF